MSETTDRQAAIPGQRRRPARSGPGADRVPGPEQPLSGYGWVQPSRAWKRMRPLLSRRNVVGILGSLVFAGLPTMIWLWWRDTPAVRMQTLGDELILGAQLTGLLGGYLLLVEIAIMARIPWLERRIGSWLATIHRSLGGYLITLLFAHAGLVIAGYSQSLGAPPVTVFEGVMTTYPYALLATVALGLLVMLGFASIRAVRRRLGYEMWHSVHLLAYLAAALAFGHELTLGAQFTRDASAKTVWITMHIIVAACVFTYRIVLPVQRAKRHRLRVRAVVPESKDTFSIYISGIRLEELGAEAGQYFRWRFMARRLWWQTHPFSLSAAPNGQELRLTVKAVGDFTKVLRFRLRPGVRVLADGPYGAFTPSLRRRQPVLLIGGGVGVTPLRALAEVLYGRPGDIVFLQRASKAADLLLTRELELLAINRGVVVKYVLGSRGRVRRHDPMSGRKLRELVPDIGDREVYICGSPGLVAASRRGLREAGVPRRRIHTELFDF